MAGISEKESVFSMSDNAIIFVEIILEPNRCENQNNNKKFLALKLDIHFTYDIFTSIS